MRSRNPCLFLRFLLEGWKVLFIFSNINPVLGRQNRTAKIVAFLKWENNFMSGFVFSLCFCFYRSTPLSCRAMRPPAGGQEAFLTLNIQTPPAVGVTKLRDLSCRAKRPPAGGQEASLH